MAHGIFPMVQGCVWREFHLNQFQPLIGKICLFSKLSSTGNNCDLKESCDSITNLINLFIIYISIILLLITFKFHKSILILFKTVNILSTLFKILILIFFLSAIFF